jgi:hypothetical protein
MITDKDIKKLTAYQLEVFKDVFVTSDVFDEKINKLQSSVDNIAKDVKVLKDDNLVMNHRVKKIENWVDKASPKLGLKFDH